MHDRTTAPGTQDHRDGLVSMNFEAGSDRAVSKAGSAIGRAFATANVQCGADLNALAANCSTAGLNEYLMKPWRVWRRRWRITGHISRIAELLTASVGWHGLCCYVSTLLPRYCRWDVINHETRFG